MRTDTLLKIANTVTNGGSAIFVGRAGCGKTTASNAVMDLLQANRERNLVEIDGVRLPFRSFEDRILEFIDFFKNHLETSTKSHVVIIREVELFRFLPQPVFLEVVKILQQAKRNDLVVLLEAQNASMVCESLDACDLLIKMDLDSKTEHYLRDRSNVVKLIGRGVKWVTAN